jgi:hypothetical protein
VLALSFVCVNHVPNQMRRECGIAEIGRRYRTGHEPAGPRAATKRIPVYAKYTE